MAARLAQIEVPLGTGIRDHYANDAAFAASVDNMAKQARTTPAEMIEMLQQAYDRTVPS